MFYFIADARDGSVRDSGCNVCCCEAVSVRPGETNMVEIDYAGWAAPLAGKGLAAGTVFELSGPLNCDDAKADNNAFLRTVRNEAVLITLPEGFAKYEIAGRYSAAHGTITHFDCAAGKFVFEPNIAYTGYDHIWWTAKDKDGSTAGGEIIIAVADNDREELPQIDFTEAIKIPADRVTVERRSFLMRFALTVSPGAVIDDIYRLNIRQAAMDCDCNKFWHEMCIDITIGKCG